MSKPICRKVIAKIIDDVNSYKPLCKSCKSQGITSYRFRVEVKKHQDLYDEYISIVGITKEHLREEAKQKIV